MHGSIGFGKGGRLTPPAGPGKVGNSTREPPPDAQDPAFFPAFRLALACGACASASGPWVSLGGQRYSVEIADTEAERARG